MSATPYKRPDVDIFICIEMARDRNRIMKKHPVFLYVPSTDIFICVPELHSHHDRDKPSIIQRKRKSDCQIVGLPLKTDWRTVELFDYQTAGLTESLTLRLSDCLSAALSDGELYHRILGLPHSWTAELPNCQTAGLPNCINVEMSDFSSAGLPTG